MQRAILGTIFTFAIASIGSAVYAKEPVPANGTTGEAATRRLEVIQQHSRDGEQPAPQPLTAASPQVLFEQRSAESTSRTCLLKPVTAGAMAQRALTAQQICERRMR
ncbi:MAG: hypothetical protein J0L70_06430 [Leptolyngbya sp. UWPOB_LEPTO1]|uniref:hypothetical protein n=1 Tax=Leptolyngbya sp. UWPOB_LEPTO1 TaxID=2815653 RepID=UPI001ACE8341|nr:hypothetical protein [Leptolyngbya sp. UWPOB_LEPTO1]MBN8560141.1 hypothetical protein [Leptolyngbya sp. UWPOB_LEPTO1]